MDVITLQGNRALRGAVSAAGSKNASLPMMAAAIMADAPVILNGTPDVTDVNTQALVLGHLGVEVKRRPDGRLHLHTVDSTPVTADAELVARMRASFCMLGPLLARRKRATVALPGGCRIGDRPVDLHLQGLAALGATIRIENNYVFASAKSLHGVEMNLAGLRGPTVTGTANIMMAAVLARGETVLRGAALEPEIFDLGQFLISLGARIDGLGTSTIRIIGVEQLGGTGDAGYEVIPDRIEAGTLLAAAAITGGDVTVHHCRPDHLAAPLAYFDEVGCSLEIGADHIRLVAPNRLQPFQLTALPYPGIPSDLQAQFMTVAAVADGRSTIGDAVFPHRFSHVPELCRLGANIVRRGATSTIDGVEQLSAAAVTASDLRASAALVLAGLAADGVTTIHRTHHLYRGYEGLLEKLQTLGANIGETRPALDRREASPALDRNDGWPGLDRREAPVQRLKRIPA